MCIVLDDATGLRLGKLRPLFCPFGEEETYGLKSVSLLLGNSLIVELVAGIDGAMEAVSSYMGGPSLLNALLEGDAGRFIAIRGAFAGRGMWDWSVLSHAQAACA